jgi:GSCFA family
MNKKNRFFTPVNIEPLEDKISPDDIIVGIGSCFAQSMLDRLFSYGFAGMQNPSGIVYNAVSISRIVERAVINRPFTEDEFFEFNGKWRSWEHHGAFSRPTLEAAVSVVNESLMQFRELLSKAKYFIITPSSSVVYKLRETGQVLANCHKVPNSMFERRLLEVDENLQALTELRNAVEQLNPVCRLLFTVSPVRHYPGDLSLNSVSKANLLAAVRKTVDLHSNSNYFPAYEIMQDELRDYRFYKSDMLHPSPLAEDIIFEHFVENCCTADAVDKITAGIKRCKAEAHRS